MGFGQSLVHKIEWKRVLAVWKKFNLSKLSDFECVSKCVRDESVEED